MTHKLSLSALLLGAAILSGCAASQTTKRKDAITIEKTETERSKYTGPKRRIGVTDFENKTAYGQTRLGTAATDILVTELAKTGKFIVVERDKLNKIMEEQKLQLSGAIDPNTALQMGKVLGLQAIVTGAVSQFGVSTTGSDYLLVQSKKQVAECTVDVRVVDAETGAVLFADSGKGVSKTGTGSFLGMGTKGGYNETVEGEALRAAIVELVDNIISQVSQKPWSCRIAEVDGDSIYVDAGLDSGLKEGLRLALFRLGKEIKSPTTGLVIGRTETKVGEAKIRSFFGEDGSIAGLINGSMPSRGDLCRLAD